jgi:putative endonuclease
MSDPAATLLSMERATIALGRAGEEAALAWYRSRGYALVARNWRCALGELDLVLARGADLVFCEVKARRGAAFGGPFEAVTGRKQRKLALLAEAFLASCGARPRSVRFDVASVLVDAGSPGGLRVHVFEHAF